MANIEIEYAEYSSDAKRKHKPQEGFQKGHKSYSYKGMNKGQISWNAGTSVWLDKVCLECGKTFKIQECHIKREGRGKYCSRKCYYKARTIHKNSPGEVFIHQLRQTEEYKKWRMECLRRDYFRCQECYTNDNLEVHHIKSFTELVSEFFKEYNQFSPVEDRETLIRLAVSYKPIWEINNGQTLCEKHHKELRGRKI